MTPPFNMIPIKNALILISLILSLDPAISASFNNEQVPVYEFQVVNIYPHDPSAFTQGLVYAGDGILYESTGLYGCSTLRRVDIVSGRVLSSYALPSWLFGEGIALWEDRIVQLTWQSNLGIIYSNQSLSPLGTFYYPTEGWGLTADSTRLIMTDGSSVLYFLDPDSFLVTGAIDVKDRDVRVTGLNELEYVKGEILANVFMTDRIAEISPVSGNVTGWIDLSDIWNGSSGEGVPNGIAYDQEGDRLFVTGKLWPHLFEIKLLPK